MNANWKILWLPLVLAAPSAMSAEFDASVRVGAGITDNINRSTANEIDETMLTAGLNFDVIEETSRIDLEITSVFDYVEYADGTIDSELIGGLTGELDVRLVDELLVWVVENEFGQTLFNPLEPARPDNREDVNIFSTGPTLSVANGRHSIVLSTRFTQANYEIRPDDNDRLSAELSLARNSSRNSVASLNFAATRADYDSDLFAPIESYEAYARYEVSGSNSEIGVDLGYNEVEYGGRSGDGSLLRIDYTSNLSANGEFVVLVGSEISNQGDVFSLLRRVAPAIDDTVDVNNTQVPFQNNFFTLAYNLVPERYEIAATIIWNQEDFRNGEDFDRDIITGSLVLDREVTRKVSIGADFQLIRRDFKYLNRRDDDLTLGLGIGYDIGSGFDLEFEYQHFQRNSTVVDGDFTENRAFVRLGYTPVWSR